MNHLKFTLILGALAITLTACCCPCGSLVPLLGSEAEFTTGDFADVPAYPGSTQTTESDPILGVMVTALSFIAEESEWKHYTTTDSDSDVLNWYGDELPGYGWSAASGENLDVKKEGGLIFEKEEDPEVHLFILAASDIDGGDETHILIGRIRISSDE
ncbi:MAG: hypothetical protein JRI70_04700 [Deltaproteobacteria bacterium]|nr:hypothetical protein [Deltaproteobacteria bacterium]MBW1859381.1 hypothetical protein [Deltaproteobacteria bacterium]